LPSQKDDLEKTHADISKAKKELGYTPQFTLERGTDECVRWCTNTMKFILD